MRLGEVRGTVGLQYMVYMVSKREEKNFLLLAYWFLGP